MIRFLIQLCWFAGWYLALRTLIVTAPVVARRARSRLRRRRARRAQPRLGLTLLVGVDDPGGSILPRVQLQGEPIARDGKIRVELVDASGTAHVVSARELPRAAVGAELPLPSFFPPRGADLLEALRWRWDVVVEVPRRKACRWSRYLVPADLIGPEAEIGPAPFDERARPDV
jgi:hypothetical protein